MSPGLLSVASSHCPISCHPWPSWNCEHPLSTVFCIHSTPATLTRPLLVKGLLEESIHGFPSAGLILQLFQRFILPLHSRHCTSSHICLWRSLTLAENDAELILCGYLLFPGSTVSIYISYHMSLCSLSYLQKIQALREQEMGLSLLLVCSQHEKVFSDGSELGPC